MTFQNLLECPNHHVKLHINQQETEYVCEHGCRFSIVNSIVRFVPSSNYASSFGLQWNEYKKTQLDSFTKLPISKQRLERLFGGSLDVVRGRKVLEAGCGAGRFTEVLLGAGAEVFAVDLSSAVEANYENCHRPDGYHVCQANLLNLPVKQGTFDIVMCIGVIQHTPCPEETIKVLCSYLKDGGTLVIDHYTHGYPATLSRRVHRFFLKRANKKFALAYCQYLTSMLWPLHVLLRKHKRFLVVKAIRRVFLWLSPIVDHQDGYPQLSSNHLKMWAALDTHDTLTDFYKHLRSAEEIRSCLAANGMVDIVTEYAGNGVEARARKRS